MAKRDLTLVSTRCCTRTWGNGEGMLCVTRI